MPHPRGASWGGNGTNFAVFSAHATKVEVCLFDSTGNRETARIELPEYTDQIFHGYLPDVGPGTFYGLARARPVRARCGTSLQSQQAAARPLCPRPCRRADVGPCRVRLPDGNRRRPDVRRTRQRALHAEMRVVDPTFDWRGEPGRRFVPWDHTIVYETHVKGYTKRHPTVPENLRGTYAGLGTRDVIDHLEIARRHRDRAAAGPHLRQRQPSAGQGADELLGLQHASASSPPIRATPPTCRIQPARIQGDGGALPRRRARGDPGRRLQPHRRRQRARPDPVVQGHRQRQLLPPAAGPEALLHQRHRHRQHAQPVSHPRVCRW